MCFAITKITNATETPLMVSAPILLPSFLARIRKVVLPVKTFALIAFAAIVMTPDMAQGYCVVQDSKTWSLMVGTAAGASSLLPDVPVVSHVRRGIVGGTAIGEMINFGISRWWDPEIEVFANDIKNIVFDISDQSIIAIADELLRPLRHNAPFETTFADLLALNSATSGMGDAATVMLISGTRAFAHILQGAAAYAQYGAGAPTVLMAANLTNRDLTEYRTALADYASFASPFDNEPGIPTITAGQYLQFLQDIQRDGASALPQGEVEMMEVIFALANVHMEGITLTDSLLAFLGAGDTGNEAAGIPPDGYTASELMLAGVGNFNIDCTKCTIAVAVPETGSLALLGVGLAGLGFSRRRMQKEGTA